MLKEGSKNAVNAVSGMFRVTTGLVMRTLDNQVQNLVKIGMISKSKLIDISIII